MKKLLILFVFVLVLCGCNSKDDIKTIMKENEYIIVDVRTKEEYEISHVKEAINIPYDQIGDSSNLDKNKVLIVYCQSGRRSKIAYDKLMSLGYKAYDLGAFDSIDLPKE